MNKIIFVLILLVKTVLLNAQLTPQQKQQLKAAQAKLQQLKSDSPDATGFAAIEQSKI